MTNGDIGGGDLIQKFSFPTVRILILCRVFCDGLCQFDISWNYVERRASIEIILPSDCLLISLYSHFHNEWLEGLGATPSQVVRGCPTKQNEDVSKQHWIMGFVLIPASRFLSWVLILASLIDGIWP